MNGNIFELCDVFDSIDMKLGDIESKVKSVSDIKSLFSSMGDFMELLEKEYSNFIVINSVMNKFKKINQIAKDEFLDDYDNIFRDLNVECEEIFGECINILKTNGDTSSIKSGISKLGE